VNSGFISTEETTHSRTKELFYAERKYLSALLTANLNPLERNVKITVPSVLSKAACINI
jgi:hypothetical protein